MSDFFNPYQEVDRYGSALPHWQQGAAFIFVTWRLADSLPGGLLQQLAAEKTDWLARNPRPWDDAQRAEYRERFPARVEQWLDRGRGACVLGRAEPRRILAASILFFEEE
ncbi:MAG: hypothetical protein ACOC4K_05355, partial [Verrucomicrobiota bacterium]